jgi:hypothetical protein
LARRVDPGATLRNDGYAPSDRPAAQHHDFLFANYGDWFAYLKTRLVDAWTVNLGPTRMLPGVSTGWTRDGGSGLMLAWRSTTNFDTLLCEIPLQVGDRVTGVTVKCKDFDATHYLQAQLYKTDQFLATDTTKSNLVDSAKTGADQTLTLTGITPATVAANELWYVWIGLIGTGGGNRLVYQVDVTIDHP